MNTIDEYIKVIFMIAFLGDWDSYPKAIPDMKTINKSFLAMCAIYRQMGVKNFYFPLTLLQPELQGLNYYDEDNLTLEQKAMILWECDNNLWFYLRECSPYKDIEDVTDIEHIQNSLYKANRANIAAAWLLISSVDYIQIQPRQTGKSYGTDNNDMWLLDHHYKNTNMVVITKDDKLRTDNIKRMRDIRDRKPPYIKRHTNKDDNNQQSMSCKNRNNNLKILVAQNSKKAGASMGRGMSSPYLRGDEGPFINYIEATMSSATGSMGAKRDEAMADGYISAYIHTTTAGDPSDRDGAYMYKLKEDAAPFDECFYDVKDRDALLDLIRANGHNLSETTALVFDAFQLGKTKEWLRRQLIISRSEGGNSDRDYFNAWKSSSDEAVLQGALATKVRESQTEPVSKEIVAGAYLFKYYEPIDSDTMYVLSIDTSEAAGNDGIGVVLVNSRTGATAGAAFIKIIDLLRFSISISKMLIDNPNYVLNIERAFNASVIFDIIITELLMRDINPFKRIYNNLVQGTTNTIESVTIEKVLNSTGRELEKYVSMYKSSFGFKTTNTSRTVLYTDVFMNTLENMGDGVNDSQLAYQLLNLVYKNGRIDHPTGGHDDMVVAYLIAQWTLRYGLNLESYGFEVEDILSDVVSNIPQSKSDSLEERYLAKRKRQRQDEVKELTEALNGCNNKIGKFRLIARIEKLLVLIGDESTSANTVSKVNKIIESNALSANDISSNDRKSNLGYGKLLSA